MSQLTTHVLDTSNGSPAEGIHVTLQFIHEDGHWEDKASGVTNSDGRVGDLIPKNELLPPGVYRIVFETGSYFNELGIKTFYPFVPVVFEISDNSHYHVPLLMNPFGYSTYRGS